MEFQKNLEKFLNRFKEFLEKFWSNLKKIFINFQKTWGIQEKIIDVQKYTYKEATAYVILDKEGRKVKNGRGVRQGYSLSPNLFNCTMEEVFRKLECKGKGLKMGRAAE